MQDLSHRFLLYCIWLLYDLRNYTNQERCSLCTLFFGEEACTQPKKITKYSNSGSFYLPLASKASQVLTMLWTDLVFFHQIVHFIPDFLVKLHFLFFFFYYFFGSFFLSLFSPFILHCWPFHSPSFCDVLQDKYFWNYSNSNSNIMLLLNVILHI